MKKKSVYEIWKISREKELTVYEQKELLAEYGHLIKGNCEFICDMEEWGWAKQLPEHRIKRCQQQCDECYLLNHQ